MPGRSAHKQLRPLATPPATAILVFAHGSKVPEANDVFVRLAAEVGRQAGLPARAAFLEIAEPDLGAAISAAVGEGARRIVIAPAFLTIGRHVSEDLPRLVREQQAAHPGIEILAGQSLEGHSGVAAILLDRAMEALGGEVSPHEALGSADLRSGVRRRARRMASSPKRGESLR